MYDKYINDILNEKDKMDEHVDLKLYDSPLYNPGALYNKLDNLDKLSDKEIYVFLKTYYNELLSLVFEKKNQKYISYFKDSRFLSIFIQVINSLREISYTNRVQCNKIAYDYYILEDGDEYQKQLLLSLSKTVNRDVIPSLIGIGLKEDLASYLALARFSSQNESTNVRRINFIIISSSIKLMTEQMIVWIYEKLFDHVTELFQTIMLDTYDENSCYSEEMQEIHSIISLAILDILNSMPTNDIRSILLSYATSYTTLHTGEKTRFSMQSLSNDYKRIREVVEYLDKEEKVYVP